MRALAVILSGILLGFTAAAQQPKPLRRAPGFSLPDTRQKQHDLADYRGRWVLLDFMRTDCPHCKELSPLLEAAAKRYGEKVAVLSIVVPPDTTQTVAAFIAENKITTPILFDCGQVTYSYLLPSPANPSVEFPHLFVIDPKGFIARDLHGATLQPARLNAELEALIGSPGRK